jgi:hypothetical protein
MLEYFYPEEEQYFFTNRDHTLTVLGRPIISYNRYYANARRYR